MIPQRLIFNFVPLRNQTGRPIHILADLIGSMEIVDVTVDYEKDGEKGKKDILMTRILTPFGQQFVVFDTPEQIAQKIEKTTLSAVTDMQRGMASQIVAVK
jgi:hypothetical protein